MLFSFAYKQAMKRVADIIDLFLKRIGEDPRLRDSMLLAPLGKILQTELSIPRVIRHHISDLADGYMFSGILNAAQMTVCSTFNKKSVSRPVACAAFIIAVGVREEYVQMKDRQAALAELKASGKFETTKNPPSPEYDWADVFSYTAGATAYVIRHRRRKIHPDSILEPLTL